MRCSVCRCSSVLLIVTSSLIFVALGLAVAALSIAGMVTAANLVVPTWYSGISLGVGLVVVLIAVFGFAGVCSRRRRCFLTIFTLFTFLVFAMSSAVCGVVWASSQAVEVARSQNFVDLDSWEKTVSESLRTLVTDTWGACDATISPTGEAEMYSLSCGNADYASVQTFVNQNCLAGPVDASASSAYYECYADTSWWAPASTSSGEVPTDPDTTLDSPKGIFCQCSDEIVDFFNQYFTLGKWIAIGVSVFFLLVFIACLYTCCCGGKSNADRQGAYLARP